MILGKSIPGRTTYQLTKDQRRLATVQMPVAGRVAKLTAYVDGLGTNDPGQVAQAVIQDNATGTLLGVGVPVLIARGQPPVWVDFPFTVPGGVPVPAGLMDIGLRAGDSSGLIHVYGDDPSLRGGKIRNDIYTADPVSPYAGEVLADKPNAYYRLNELTGTAITDDAGTNLGTISGGYTLGQAGGTRDGDTAILFSGGHIDVNDSASFHVGDVFSFGFWIKVGTLPTAGNFQVILTRGTNGFSARIDSAGHIILRKSGVSDIAASTSTLSADGKFHHVLVTKTGATVHIYIDGVDVTGAVTNATIADTALTFRMGDTQAGGMALTSTLDEVAVYPTALSSARALARYQAVVFTTLTADMAIFASYFQDWTPLPETDFYYGRLPFAESQARLSTTGPVTGTAVTADAEWHGTQLNAEWGAFCLVNRHGPLAERVGERLRVTRMYRGQPLSVVAYCCGDAVMDYDLSLTRQMFARLGPLWSSSLPVVVETLS